MEDRITEEQYLAGEKNGISRKNVYQRWYHYGWDIERATTEPIQKFGHTGWIEWKETALKNGISHTTYCNRVKAGLTHEQAATLPIRGNVKEGRLRKWEVNEDELVSNT